MSFETRRLRELCLRQNVAETELGTVNAKGLETVIADIEALENGQELLGLMDGTVHVLEDDTIEISFGLGCSAIFVVAGKRFQEDQVGRVIWSTVRRLKLLAIEGCDGK